ncbi:MAG: hypothetical protein ACJ8D8_16155 [Microvirga sp.]|jgi:hypothetical protein|nr:hypothetical protein [Beijerinckiaceae bacterium]
MTGGTPHRHPPFFVIVGNVAHHRRQRCASSPASLRIIGSVDAARCAAA